MGEWVEELSAHLWVLEIGLGVVGKMLVGSEGRGSGSALAGKGSPVVLGVDSWVPEHHPASWKVNVQSV